MINYTLFGGRTNKRLFGPEILNLVNSGKHFVKSGMDITNIGGLNYQVASGEYYFNGTKVSFSVQNVTLTAAGSGKFKLSALLVDSLGNLTFSDGTISSTIGGVKGPTITSTTHFCVGLVLLSNAAGEIFNISLVNDYFSDIYMDETMLDGALINALDIFKLQGVFKSNASYTPVTNPFALRDWFTDSTGKLNTVDSGNSTAHFDTDNYHRDITIGASEYSGNGTYTNHNDGNHAIATHDLSADPKIITDIRCYCYAYANISIQGYTYVNLTYVDDTTSGDMEVGFAMTYMSDNERTFNYHVNPNNKLVKTITISAATSSDGVVNQYTTNVRCYNTIFEKKVVVTIPANTATIGSTYLNLNIDGTVNVPAPQGSTGITANQGYVGGAQSSSMFTYNIYDVSNNCDSGLLPNVKNDIVNLTTNPVKLEIVMKNPAGTTPTNYYHTGSGNVAITTLPVLTYISGYPLFKDYNLILYEVEP